MYNKNIQIPILSVICWGLANLGFQKRCHKTYQIKKFPSKYIFKV